MLKTFLVPITWLDSPFTIIEHGIANGYVLLPKGHKYHGADCDDIPVECHGGLTFANPASDCSFVTEEADKDGWVVGFDTCHYGDTSGKWTREAVRQETDNLARQLEELQ